MQRLWKGIVYCLLWYGSIMSGFFLIACPLLPLLFISPMRFRKYGDLLFSCWELYPTALLRLFGVKIVVSGDHIIPSESAILIMNHRTRVDWNFLWAAMYQACLPYIGKHKLKFILKDPIRHIPGPGWIMQMNNFLYITRKWEEDQGRLTDSINYFMELRQRIQLLIFPEGTDLTKKSIERSNKYAQKNELPFYKFVLHPKTTGFSYIVQSLESFNYLDAVYDLTIAYPDYVPQTELDLIIGKLPNEVHFHIKRINNIDVPKEENHLRKWLEEKWLEKEATLKEFYEKKMFTNEPWSMTDSVPLRLALCFWSLITVIATTLMIISPIFRLWTLVHSSLFIGLSIFNKRFSQIEMGWYWHFNPKPSVIRCS